MRDSGRYNRPSNEASGSHFETQFVKHAFAVFAVILCVLALALPTAAEDRLKVSSETFEIDGHKGIIYPAPQPALGKPWLWYAPTLNGVSIVQRKLYFESLMKAGISIAGFDLGEGARLTGQHGEVFGLL